MVFDATELAHLIQTNQLSPLDAVDDTLNKITELNPILNAVTHVRERTDILADITKMPKSAPFAGVPILLKNLGQSLAGLPNTASSRLFKDTIANHTDNYVAALQRAGFIIVGNTNAPEFGFKNITDPSLYGATRNPWQTDFSAGGSSGGSASAVAANIVTLAAASDGGGSIRIPASFSGLIGLKPTRGRVPVGPAGWRGWQGASINFAETRSIRDTAKLLDQLQVIQPAAPFQTPLITPSFSYFLNQPLKSDFKVAYTLKSPVNTPVSADAQTAVLNAVTFLEDQGIKTVEVDNSLPGKELMMSYYIVNGGETASMFAEIERYLNRPMTIADMELTTWVIYQAGKGITASDYSQTLALWDQASFQADQFFDSYDAYLMPTTATTAPAIDAQLIDNATQLKMQHVTELSHQDRLDLVYDFFADSLALTPFTQQANLTGQPAISLPTHIAKNGLPLGIQFTARKGQEATLLQIGKLFEDHAKFKLLDPTTIIK